MAKVAQPTTGFIDNGGLVQLGMNNTSEQWDYITLAAPSAPWRILVEGDLPTTSTTPNMSVSFLKAKSRCFQLPGHGRHRGRQVTMPTSTTGN